MSETTFEGSIENILQRHDQVPGVSLTLVQDFQSYPFAFGLASVSKNEVMTTEHYLQCASLSKTVAAAFAIEYFQHRHNIPMTTSVNSLLIRYGASWKIEVSSTNTTLPKTSGDDVTLAMLINHTALGMHYVYGIPLDRYVPRPVELLDGTFATQYKYPTLYLERVPGKSFSYSGGGFVVLQYLIELIEETSIDVVTRSFLDACGLQDFTFFQLQGPLTATYATGHVRPNQEVIPPLAFPPFAAGGLCTTKALSQFLIHLAQAYHNTGGSGAIRHETARLMLGEASLVDLGSLNFMGAKVSGLLWSDH